MPDAPHDFTILNCRDYSPPSQWYDLIGGEASAASSRCKLGPRASAADGAFFWIEGLF